MRRYRKRLLASVATVALLGTAAFAHAADVILGPATATTVNQKLMMQIGPKKLPKNKWTPGTMRVRIEAKFPKNEPRAPRTDRIHVWLDKNIKVNTKGLPTCREAQLEDRDHRVARKVCYKAIIGAGDANAWVAMADSLKIPAPAPVTIFNGAPKGRKPVYLVHAFTTVPVPTTFVVPGVYEKSKGPWGYELDFEVPEIAGGYGSLDYFDARTGVTLKNKKAIPKAKKPPVKNLVWKFKGKKQHYGYGRCRGGKLKIKAQFWYSTRTADDTEGPNLERKAQANAKCRG